MFERRTDESQAKHGGGMSTTILSQHCGDAVVSAVLNPHASRGQMLWWGMAGVQTHARNIQSEANS